MIDSVASFGHPRPVMVFTGGDCMMRTDLQELVKESKMKGMAAAISPAVSTHLEETRLLELANLGVKSVSVSLDGATAATHDWIRCLDGHFDATLDAAAKLSNMGFSVQINTAVMKENVHELADIASILMKLGIRIWEVFFLVAVGRGERMHELTPEEHEDVCNFLADVTRYGLTVRTVEAPFFRRVLLQRRSGSCEPADRTSLYTSLRKRMVELLGEPQGDFAPVGASTRDGKGVIFIGHDGEIFPSGFLPYSLGNVRTENIVDVYRNDETLLAIRSAMFKGKCGICEYRDICGGSRSRAFQHYNDALAEDPACIYEPPLTNEKL